MYASHSRPFRDIATLPIMLWQEPILWLGNHPGLILVWSNIWSIDHPSSIRSMVRSQRAPRGFRTTVC